jgi:hypothetical protein
MNCSVETEENSHQIAEHNEEGTDLTLAQQLVAYGQHLHERPQFLVLSEQLSQVLTAEEAAEKRRSCRRLWI